MSKRKEIEDKYANLCAILGDATVRLNIAEKAHKNAMDKALNALGQLSRMNPNADSLVPLPAESDETPPSAA